MLNTKSEIRTKAQMTEMVNNQTPRNKIQTNHKSQITNHKQYTNPNDQNSKQIKKHIRVPVERIPGHQDISREGIRGSEHQVEDFT